MAPNDQSTPVSTRGERIVHEVTSWPGITTDSGDFGETEFLLEGSVHVRNDETGTSQDQRGDAAEQQPRNR